MASQLLADAAAAAAAGARRAAMAAAEGADGAAAVASDDSDELRDWLLHSAGVHMRFVDNVVEKLVEEEVCTVADVGVLAGLPRFKECGFSAVTAAKILSALADPAPSDAETNIMPKPAAPDSLVLSQPSMSTPTTSRVRSRVLVTPTAPTRRLFATPPRAEARDDEAVALQAAARRWLVRVRLDAARRAAARMQAAWRRLLWRRSRARFAARLAGSLGPFGAALAASPSWRLQMMLGRMEAAAAWHERAAQRAARQAQMDGEMGEENSTTSLTPGTSPSAPAAAPLAADAGRCRTKNEKTKARRARARAAKLAAAEASDGCAMVSEMEAEKSTTLSAPGNSLAAQAADSPRPARAAARWALLVAAALRRGRVAQRWERLAEAALAGRDWRAGGLLAEWRCKVKSRWDLEKGHWAPVRRLVRSGVDWRPSVYECDEPARIWDGFDWAPNPLYAGEVPAEPTAAQWHRYASGWGRAALGAGSDDDWDPEDMGWEWGRGGGGLSLRGRLAAWGAMGGGMDGSID